MRSIGSVNALALAAALATVGAATALAAATPDSAASTRQTYVVGGEVVHPPQAHLEAATLAPVITGPYSTRQAYVVGGALVGAGQ